jgi:rubrerythrin
VAKQKEELIKMLNRALELEHAARIQYLTHAQLISGSNSPFIIARLQEIAKDEQGHESKFRTWISNYLGSEPTMNLAETHRSQNTNSILRINLKQEKDAVAFYKQILEKIQSAREHLPYEFETLKIGILQIIVDEQEHIVELRQLLGLR